MIELSMPIGRVLVMEDRAQVERRGSTALRGLTRFRVEGLSPIAVDKSLTAHVTGGTLVEARLERRAIEVPLSGLAENASALKAKAHALGIELQVAADTELEALRRPEQLLAARAQVLAAVSRLVGFGVASVETWTEQLQTLRLALEAADRASLAAQRHRAALERTAQELRAALSATEIERVMRCTLFLTIEGQGEASLIVRYLVPCAAWRPSYVATLNGATVQVSAQAMVWQRTLEDWSQVTLALSTARPTLGSTPPSLNEDRLRLRPKSATEKQVVDVALREEEIQTTGEGGAPGLPGVDDGGEAQQLEVGDRASVPADGKPHQIPLFSFDAPATVEQICVAELSPLVDMVASFANTSGRVLLAGPTQLIRQAGVVGRAMMSFTAPGETAKLPFGPSDALRVVRIEAEKTDEAMLTGKRTTVHTVNFHISNAGAEPARFFIEERIPVSEVKEVEVELLTSECNPMPSAVTVDGLTRLECHLPPHGTQQATFVWRLVASSKVAGV